MESPAVGAWSTTLPTNWAWIAGGGVGAVGLTSTGGANGSQQCLYGNQINGTLTSSVLAQPITAPGVLVLKYWVKRENTGSFTATSTILVGGTPVASRADVIATNAWTQYTLNYAAAAADVGRTIQLQFNFSNGSGAWQGYFDEVELASAPTTVGFGGTDMVQQDTNASGAVSVFLGRAVTNTVTVGYYLAGGTAVLGTDFSFVPGTLTFAPGVVSNGFSFSVFSNLTYQGSKTVVFGLNNASNAALGNFTRQTVLIATTYTVELTGNDANSGRQGAPWRTLTKACQTVTANQGHVIQVGQGTFTEPDILTLKSGVSLIGAGSGKTTILVNHFFSLTNAVVNANPSVNTFPEHFVIQINGSNQVVKGFTLDGQSKQCHGGIYASWTQGVVFDDLRVNNFNYCGLWMLDANNTALQFSNFKNNTFGSTGTAGGDGADSGAVQFLRGVNLSIHDNRIEETGNISPDFGGFALKAQDLTFSISTANVLEGLRVYNNTLIVPTLGSWKNGLAPAITAEFLGMALKNCEIYNNILNNHVSIVPSASLGWGVRLHHNFFNLGWSRYAYAVEASVNNLEFDHNYIFGGLYPISVWAGGHDNHNLHHNIFEGASAGQFAGQALLNYSSPITNLRFINNTILDKGGIGTIFNLAASSTYEARNNLVIRTLAPADIWGTAIAGTVSHNFFSGVTPRGTNAGTGSPGISVNLVAGTPLASPYYTIQAGSPLLDAGLSISPWTDGFTGTAPDIGAIELERPVLAATSSPGSFALSWPTVAGVFSAYFATSLTPPVVWTPLTNTPVLVSNKWSATLPAATSGQRFYRLQLQ